MCVEELGGRVCACVCVFVDGAISRVMSALGSVRWSLQQGDGGKFRGLTDFVQEREKQKPCRAKCLSFVFVAPQ